MLPKVEASIREYVASDGYVLRYRHWQPNTVRPRGFIVAVHGIQSHSGWYEGSSRWLCEAGYEVCFLDRRGSGLNEAVRGHAVHEDRLVNDVAQFLIHTRWRRDALAPDSPVILKGVSWGGKLATTTYARRPELVDALALLYPGIKARFQTAWYQRLPMHLAVLKGWGGVWIKIPLIDPTLFTDEPKWREFIANDPLTLRYVTISFLLASHRMTPIADACAERIHCPVLMMLAGRDRIIDNEATKRFFERIGTQHKRLIEYPDAMHTLEFEKDPEPFINDLLHWLNHLPRQNGYNPLSTGSR